MWFKAILGLRINLDKRKLIPVGNVDDEMTWPWSWVVRWAFFFLLLGFSFGCPF